MDLASSSWIAIVTGVLVMVWGVVEIFIKSAVFTSGRWLYIVHRDGNTPMYWIAVGLKFIGGVVIIVGAFAVPAFTAHKALASKIDDQTAAAADSASAAAAAPSATHAAAAPPVAPKHAATGGATPGGPAGSQSSKPAPSKSAKPGK